MVIETFNNAEIIDTNERDLRVLFYKIFLSNKNYIKKRDIYKPHFDIDKKYQNDKLNNLNTQSYLQNFKFLNMVNTTKKLSYSVKNDFYINKKKETDDSFIINFSKYPFLERLNFIDCNYVWNECIDKNLLMFHFKDKFENDSRFLNEKCIKEYSFFRNDKLKINYNLKSLLEKYQNFFENIYLVDSSKNILNKFDNLSHYINKFNYCYNNNRFTDYFNNNNFFYLEECLNNYFHFLELQNEFNEKENKLYNLKYFGLDLKKSNDIICVLNENEQVNINYDNIVNSSKNVNIIIKNSKNLNLINKFVKKMKLLDRKSVV